MFRKIAIAAVFLLPAFAYAQAPSFSAEDYQVALQAMQAQRDNNANQIVELTVKLATEQRKNAKLTEELSKLQKTGNKSE